MMKSNKDSFVKILFESGLWLIPIVLIILEFFPKTGWRTNGIALNLLIWAVRIVLAPLIVWIFIKKFCSKV